MSILLDAWGVGKTICLNPRVKRPYEIRAWDEPPIPKYTIPPMIVDESETIDLTPFLLYENVIINKNSLAFIYDSSFIPKQTKSLFQYLEGNNILTSIDYQEKLRKKEAKIIRETEFDLANPQVIQIAIDATKSWRNYLLRLQKKNIQSQITTDTIVGIDRYLHAIKRGDIDEEILQLLKHQIWDVKCLTELHEMMQSPVYFWQDYSAFFAYNMLNKSLESLDYEEAVKIKRFTKLWNLYVPVSPSYDSDKFLNILENKKIHYLRQFVKDSSLNPDRISEQLIKQVNEEIVNIDKTVDKFSKIAGVYF